jgi:hypothetical protein
MSRDHDNSKPQRPRPRKVVSAEVAARVQKHALATLAAPKRATTNLYMAHSELAKGERIGPPFAETVLEQATVLVFADEYPRTSYSHDCMYMLYDSAGRVLRTINAQFPPIDLVPNGPLRLFHEPISVQPKPVQNTKPPTPPCPILTPVGRRHAILFAGKCDPVHVNDLELLYRTLTGQYAFDPADVHVYAYDGTKNPNIGVFSLDGHPGTLRDFPDADPAFHMPLRGAGTRKNLSKVLEDISEIIQPQDLLFIHLDGHGGNGNDGKSFLYTQKEDHHDPGRYSTTDLAADLHAFQNKPYRALMAVVVPCHGGGFRNTILNVSQAAKPTSVCWAAEQGQWAYWTADNNFGLFAFHWITAQGNPMVSDEDDDGAVEASEAFAFAEPLAVADSPGELYKDQGEDIALSEPNPVEAQWCSLLSPVLGDYWKDLPERQFHEKLRLALPALRKQVLPVLEANARLLKKQLTPKIEKICAEAFGRKPPRHGVGTSDRPRAQPVRARRR